VLRIYLWLSKFPLKIVLRHYTFKQNHYFLKSSLCYILKQWKMVELFWLQLITIVSCLLFMGYRLDGHSSIPGGVVEGFFLLHQCVQKCLRIHWAFYPIGTEASLFREFSGQSMKFIYVHLFMRFTVWKIYISHIPSFHYD